jgi:pimeloyl-ACP methyl ester carboxylesterase
VLLVASSSSTDRDGTVSGVPILGQIANALADAGYLTLRYDRRGSGQSGGRSESATIETHADDARALVRHLDRRDDVDQDRITLLGHDDGGWVAIIAARRERRADNLVLVGTPAGTGTELILEQQRAALDQLAVPEAERAENIRLQRQIHDAVLDGGTWNGVPEAMRSQADTPWFRSFLEFDAADTLRRTRQPLLILRGSLDQQAGPHHAEQLEVVARTRRREATVEVLTLDGLDHLLVETESSDQPAYGDLSRSSVSQLFTNRLINWLARTR